MTEPRFRVVEVGEEGRVVARVLRYDQNHYKADDLYIGQPMDEEDESWPWGGYDWMSVPASVVPALVRALEALAADEGRA